MRIFYVCVLAACAEGGDLDRVDQDLVAAPSNAVAVPGDYDGDGLTDFAVKGSNGIWYIDMAACSGGRCLDPDGYGGRWDFAYPGYGDATAIPVPADYDGDGKTDLAVKDATGMWAIDYAANGFGVWDVMVYGYGDSTVVPVPADYDGDGKADLSIKTSDGHWFIDYASDGFGGWNAIYAGYGNSSAVPVPADYDGDRKADLAVKDASGTWYIDYASNGFGAWNAIYAGYGGSTAVPVPADYDGDGRADLAVKDASGTWYVDYASDGFGAWNAAWGGYGGSTTKAIPGHYHAASSLDLATEDTSGYFRVSALGITIYNPGRPLFNPNQPYIEWTKVYLPNDAVQSVPRGTAASNELTPPAPLVNGQYQLRIGVRYTVAVRLNPGAVYNNASVEVNPDLHVPASLRVENRVGATFQWITAEHTRVFAVTCTQPGSFPLGFMLRDGGTGNWMNPDYGIRVACDAAHTGLYGQVAARVRDSNARYVASGTIANATVTVTGPTFATTTTGADGSWSFPALTGGPYRVSVTAAGRTAITAVNVMVPPGSGTEVDTPLDTTFLLGSGLSYKQFLDYSRGRELLHVVTADTTRQSVKLAVTDYVGSDWATLISNAQARNAPVIANGGFFGYPQQPCDPDPAIGADSVGYFYTRGYVHSELLACSGQFPMLAITGTGVGQQVRITQTDALFKTSSSTWTQTSSGPIYDPAAPKGVSDVDYAVQMVPALVTAGTVTTDTDAFFPRTTVGTNGTKFWIVVGDGEGVNGGHGAQFDQLGNFYKTVLGATDAMALDGGLSTELVLRASTTSWRNVNTISGEDNSWDSEPTLEGETLETHYGAGGAAGLPGSVFDYVSVGF